MPCVGAEEEEYDAPELLVGWGLTTEADLLCWRADTPDPNEWTTVIWHRQWAAPGCWAAFDFGMVDLLCRYAARDLPEHWTFELPYTGARFLHGRDASRFMDLGIDPWDAEAPVESERDRASAEALDVVADICLVSSIRPLCLL